jgi:uncharacterized protein with PIN domain
MKQKIMRKSGVVKLMFGKPVEMEDNSICDICNEKKLCFRGLNRKRESYYWKYKVHYQWVNERFWSVGDLVQIVDKFSLETLPTEFQFHICPDCVKQLNDFTKEIKE